jgi:hypothetical protein
MKDATTDANRSRGTVVSYDTRQTLKRGPRPCMDTRSSIVGSMTSEVRDIPGMTHPWLSARSEILFCPECMLDPRTHVQIGLQSERK